MGSVDESRHKSDRRGGNNERYPLGFFVFGNYYPASLLTPWERLDWTMPYRVRKYSYLKWYFSI